MVSTLNPMMVTRESTTSLPPGVKVASASGWYATQPYVAGVSNPTIRTTTPISTRTPAVAHATNARRLFVTL